MKDNNTAEGGKLYTTLGGEGFFEITIDKSVFYGYAKRVTEEKDAVDFINQIKKKHSDARHNVYAYVLKDTNTTRYSDDGEPAGTAGMPVLDVIRKTGFTDAVIVVTRYFGGILLGKGGLLEIVTVAQLSCGNLEQLVKFSKEGIDTKFLVFNLHTLDSQTHDVDCREREVTTRDGCLLTKTVLKHTGTATHRSHLILITLWIVSTPLLVVVVCCVKIHEVREESSCRHLAGKAVEVVVAILGQVAHTSLLLPDLDWEDSSRAATNTLKS